MSIFALIIFFSNEIVAYTLPLFICLHANPKVRMPNLSDGVIVKMLKYAIRYTI